MLSKLTALLRREDGSIAVEFMILFPLCLMLLLFIIWASMILGAASDVQALAHDLARSALRYSGSTTPANICNTLKTTELPQALARVASSIQLSAIEMNCVRTANIPKLGDNQISVEVVWNYAGGQIADLGRNFGVSITSITKRAVMIY